MSTESRHTIILAQFVPGKANSKCYSDHETVADAMEGLCQLFEARLKANNKDMTRIQYDISDLFAFIDELPDLGLLVYDMNIGGYIPHDKEWVKKRIFTHLERKVSQN